MAQRVIIIGAGPGGLASAMLLAKAGADVTILEKQPRVGVRTAQGEQRADSVMVNADFANAITKLVPDNLRRRWSDANVAKIDFSCSTFMLYLGVEGTCDHLAHHNIYVASDYRRNLDEIERQHVLSEDPSFYVENPVRTDATMAPAGHSALYVRAVDSQ